jgi:hypothetical protein
MTDEILARAVAAIEGRAYQDAIALLRPLAEAENREAQFRLGFSC